MGLVFLRARYYDPFLGQFTQPDALVPDPLHPIAWNRYAYAYNSPLVYADPSGHFPIDWLLDIGGLALDIYQLRQNPSLANWGWLALDVVLWALPYVPAGAGALAHADEAADAGHILVVGENSFEYSQNLRRVLGAEYDIVATSYESRKALEAMGLSVPRSRRGFRVITGVDATDLARYFGPGEFDLIIFNNPRAVKGWQKATGDLIEGVLQSAPDVLRAGGEVHFGVTPGKGLATPRLGSLTRKGGHGRFRGLGFERFADYMYRAPFQPMRSGGLPLNYGADIMVWYRFKLIP